MLHVCYGNQLEVLAEQLAEHLDNEVVDPLEPELIAVQGPAVSRWLALRLATDRGISANNKMLFPAELLWLLFRRVLPEDVPPFNGFSAQTLAWRVLELLQSEQFKNWTPSSDPVDVLLDGKLRWFRVDESGVEVEETRRVH